MTSDGDQAGPAGAVRLEAPIRRVEVFRDSALVERRVELSGLDGGGSERAFELGGLPLGLHDGSLRATFAPAVEGCAVLEAQVGLDVRSPVEERTVDEAEQLRALYREREDLAEVQRRLARRADEYGAWRPTLPLVPKRPDMPRFVGDQPLEGWLALSSLGREEAERAWARHRELSLEQRRLDDKIREAEDRLAGISSERLTEIHVSKKVYLRLALADRPERLELRLSYQVRGARWVPSYELRVDGDGTGAELAMSALVAQVTGEDWRGVELSLSTADLHRRCELPRLGAWRIGRPRSDERRAWRPLPDDLPALFSDFDRDRPPEPEPAAIDDGTAREVERLRTQLYEANAVAAPEPELAAELAEPEAELGGGLDDTGAFAAQALALDQMALPAAEPIPAAAPMMVAGGLSPAASAGFAGSRSHERAEAKKAKRRKRDVSAASASAPAPGAAAAPVPEERPDEGLLDYGRLLLAAPGEGAGRGLLRPMAREEALAPALREATPVAAALAERDREREQRLWQLEQLALPRGARDVGASAGHFAYRYATGASAEIPADGRLHRISVVRDRLPIELLYRAVPRIEEGTVYRLARAENPLENPLLAGPLDVFWGNDFIVTARLDTTAAGAAIEANLGVEPRVKVARNARHDEREEGLLGGKRVHEEELTIDVKNGLPRAALIEVIERLPVTEERKLEIELLRERPAGEDYRQKERGRPIRGGRRWRLRLEAGAEQRCQLRYAMTMPSSSEIVGGGRRA